MGAIAPQYSQDAILKCESHKLAGGVTEGLSHYEGRGGRSVTGVSWWHKQKSNWEHGKATSGHEV